MGKANACNVMNISEIEKGIEELKNSVTTYQNCAKLADLIACRNYLKSIEKDTVIAEYGDILPAYRAYSKTKKQYQLGEIGEQNLIVSMQAVCKEVGEFIKSLYNSTESPQERQDIIKMIDSLNDIR